MANEFYIPDNYDTGSTFLGIPYRNIAEGLLLGGFLVWLEWKIPFVLTIKITIALIVFIISVILGCIGVKGESTSQFLFACIKFFFTKRRMHLQPPGVLSKTDEKMRAKMEKKNEFDEKIDRITKKITG